MSRPFVRALRTGLLAALLVAGGCSEEFQDIEMHLGLEGKTRPLAIVCEPPEAAPGDTVQVTLYLHTPDPASCVVSWQVALDYISSPYGGEGEGHLVPLAAPAPVHEGDGFLSQRFAFVVPDSTLLWASSLHDPLDDPAVIALAAVLLPGAATPPRKAVVDDYLAGLTPAALAGLAPAMQTAARDLADRFACRIRFRAAVDSDVYVEVTRSLTVRRSGRVGSPNTNANMGYGDFEVIAIPYPDVAFADLPLYAAEAQHFPFVPAAVGAPAALVPRHAGWTYYLTLSALRQEYSSPYGGETLLIEVDTYRWYYFNLTAPTNPHALYRNDNGDPTEMWALDSSVRLEPPAGEGEQRYRVIGCLRDSRPEWELYAATPGLTLVAGDLIFLPPTAAGAP